MTTQTPYLTIARDLARRGGTLAKDLMGKTPTSVKADRSVVTEADKRVQDLIVGELATAFPDHGLIAEEDTALTAGRPGGDADYVWTIDPIDGTRNYAAGICLYCCSIALLHRGKPIVGAIYDPNVDWLFSASDHDRATLNDRPITVREKNFSQGTVLAYTLSTYERRPACLHELLDKCVLRNVGSVALHLAMAAAGKIDAAVNFSGKLWDVAAGALIAEQAGATILPIDIDQPIWPMALKNYHNESVRLAAGNPELIAEMTPLFKESPKKGLK